MFLRIARSSKFISSSNYIHYKPNQIYCQMGQDQPKPKQKTITLEEAQLELRMSSKKFEYESKRAAKEKEQQIKKAKEALKKNNEEGARLYLQNAAMKQKESMNCLRMAHKLDVVSTIMKSNQINTDMREQLNKLSPVLTSISQNTPIEEIYKNMTNFDEAMDGILVQNKILEETMNKSMGDTQQELAVDTMFTQMKKEMMNEINTDFNANKDLTFKNLETNAAMTNNQVQQNKLQN